MIHRFLKRRANPCRGLRIILHSLATAALAIAAIDQPVKTESGLISPTDAQSPVVMEVGDRFGIIPIAEEPKIDFLRRFYAGQRISGTI